MYFTLEYDFLWVLTFSLEQRHLMITALKKEAALHPRNKTLGVYGVFSIRLFPHQEAGDKHAVKAQEGLLL